MLADWLAFLQPKGRIGQNARDAAGVSVPLGQAQKGYDRDLSVDPRMVNDSFTPPVLSDGENFQPKRQKSTDADADGAVPTQTYSDSRAYSLTTPILEAIKKLVETA